MVSSDLTTLWERLATERERFRTAHVVIRISRYFDTGELRERGFPLSAEVTSEEVRQLWFDVPNRSWRDQGPGPVGSGSARLVIWPKWWQTYGKANARLGIRTNADDPSSRRPDDAPPDIEMLRPWMWARTLQPIRLAGESERLGRRCWMIEARPRTTPHGADPPWVGIDEVLLSVDDEAAIILHVEAFRDKHLFASEVVELLELDQPIDSAVWVPPT